MTQRHTVGILGIGVVALALASSIGLAHAIHPPGYFTKYLQAATIPATSDPRASDYSALYRLLARALVPEGGAYPLLLAQCLIHAVLSLMVFITVRALAGNAVGFIGGAIAATYRPLLVYTAVLEPEILLAGLLALAIGAGYAARRHLLAGASILALILAALASASLGLAALCRPPALLLAPVWAWWLAIAAPRQSRAKVAGFAALVPLLVVAPVAIDRARGSGSPVIMDPGAVFYEGNASQATGGAPWQGSFLVAVELANLAQSDYGHVAYHRIAAAALARTVTPTDANRYFTQLALEGVRAYPRAAVRRVLEKLARALGPHELHDLPEAFELDRRLRQVLPLGFALLLVPLPLLALTTRRRLAELGGPLAVAALSCLQQVALSSSARQRLPLVVGLLFVVPVLVADAFCAGRPRRPAFLALTLGACIAMACAWALAPISVYAEYRMEKLLGATADNTGERVASVLDGRAFAARVAVAAFTLEQAEDLAEAGKRTESESLLARLRPELHEMPSRLVARVECGLARCRVVEGDFAGAGAAVQRALTAFPADLAAQALAVALHCNQPASLRDWRPPGIDPFTARYALAHEIAALYGPTATDAIVAPILTSFPELAGTKAWLPPAGLVKR
jgi:hypothetical protein